MNKKNQILTRLFIVIFGLFLGAHSWASTPVTGTIASTEECPAYVSKNKRTNPGGVTLEINKSYQVFESNKATNPDWYRILVTDASPAERWVAKHCGTVHLQTGEPDDPDSGDLCTQAGHEDSYKLALSWQPAFCETHRSKPECSINNPEVYQARNFVLHGLWPNKKECGIHYGYCGDINSKPGHFCDYPALDLFTEVRSDLEQVMPSAEAGSCLQRHEWFKHGTCQVKWTIDDYFEHSTDLTRQFNESGIGYFMSRNIGKEVSEAEFFKRVDCALGDNAHKRLQLKCKNGNLVEIYINLPVDSSQDEDLSALMSRAAEDFKSSCNGDFRIDPIGFVQ